MLVTRNAVSFQLGIPPNQWEAEVQAWVKFLVAVTQTTITHIAAGPGIVRPDFDQLAEPLDWPGLCSRQRMGAPDGYSNINVFALALVVALSGIIILTNLSLVPTLRYLHRRHGLFQQVMVSWTQESILQVQRKAYEGAGYSEWLDRDAAVPKTNNNMPIPGLGTEEFAARIGGMALVNRDARRPEGSLPSPSASHPPLPPPLSSNPHLPLGCSAGDPEVVDVLEEVEREDATNESPSRPYIQSSIVSVSASTSVEQVHSLDNQLMGTDLKVEVSDAIYQKPGLGNIGQDPELEPPTLAIAPASQALPPSP
jgi:hypothetical protein